MHANNATAYGRMLLDTLFTRQELKDSLLFASKKSEKPALDRAKVELLLGKWIIHTTGGHAAYCGDVVQPYFTWS